MRRPHLLLAIIVALTLNACAMLSGREPVQVTVASMTPLASEGLEARMLIKLRVQNPNDEPLEYDGISLQLNVQGSTYASGVSDARGTIPRFGEAVIEVPVTISTLRVALRTFKMISDGKAPEKLNYTLTGRLGGPMFGAMRFEKQGELAF
jgi:LEA14-like dessication related protein